MSESIDYRKAPPQLEQLFRERAERESYFAKKWPADELVVLLSLQTQEKRYRLVPVLHGLTIQRVKHFNLDV